MAAIWPVIGGGLVGSFLTWLLTFVRERRRTNDAYRAPQRIAIGEIVEATYELTLRVHAFRDINEELLTETRDISDTELNDVSSQTTRAILGLGRAFHVGRLTIVDAECYEAMGEAFNNFAEVQRALRGVGEVEPTADNMRVKVAEIVEFTRGLNDDVFILVKAGQKHLSPVQTWRNRRQRAEVRKRLEAKYFEPLQDLGATF